MGSSKKGWRIIVVDECEYMFKIPNYKTVSEWKNETEGINEEFLQHASYYGLGRIMEVVFEIIVRKNEKQVKSHLAINYCSIIIDAFMGPVQISSIKPKLIAKLIKKGISDGWNPSEKGNYKINLKEKLRQNKPNEISIIVNGKEILISEALNFPE